MQSNMEEFYEEYLEDFEYKYMLQPGDIPLGEEQKKIEGIKSVGRVFLGLLGILVFIRLISDGQAPEAEYIVSFCGLLTMIVVFGASLSRSHILVTTINGKKESRTIVNAGLTRMLESIHEWDDELFNEIMNQHGAVFGEINLEQFMELYEIDVSAREKSLVNQDIDRKFGLETDLRQYEHSWEIFNEALFKTIDTDNNGMISLEDIKQGCSRGYKDAYPQKFMSELEERKKQQVMAEYKASKSN
tara:strand:- start:469 stop:1203 length:735 start_codon:yes stop_codon:yes gene_type:complete